MFNLLWKERLGYELYKNNWEFFEMRILNNDRMRDKILFFFLKKF